MKGLFNYDKGLVQDIVYPNDLIRNFESIGYTVIHNSNLVDIEGSDSFESFKKLLKDEHKKICRLFRAIVFEKTSHRSQQGGNQFNHIDNYRQNKMLYKLL